MSVVLEEGEKSELSTPGNAFLTWKWEDLIVVWPFQLVFVIHHLYRNRYKAGAELKKHLQPHPYKIPVQKATTVTL